MRREYFKWKWRSGALACSAALALFGCQGSINLAESVGGNTPDDTAGRTDTGAPPDTVAPPYMEGPTIVRPPEEEPSVGGEEVADACEFVNPGETPLHRLTRSESARGEGE